MSLDELLKDIGGVSYFQILILIALAFPKIVPCCNILLPIFVSYERSFNCSNSLIDQDSQQQQQQTNQSLDAICSELTNLNKSSPPFCSFDNITFDRTIMDSTLQSQYLLICDREYLTAISSSIFFVGILLGSFLYGVLSDKFGRIRMLSVVSFHNLLVGAALPFAPNIWLFIFGKLLIGIACGGLLTVSNVTFTEFMPAEQRLRLQMVYANVWALGYFFYICLGYFIRNHQHLQLAILVPALPTCFFVFILPESPRWLLSKKKYDLAFKATQTIAKCNRKNLSRDCFDERISPSYPLLDKNETNADAIMVEFEVQQNDEQVCSLQKEESLIKLLKNKWFFLVTMVNWFNFLSVAMMDLTLIYFTKKLGGNIYITLVFMAIVEVPGTLNLMVIGRYLGRVTIIIMGYSSAGFVAILLAIFYKKKSFELVCIIVAIIGKFLTGSILNIYWVYSFESYPTAIRNSVVGSCVTFASIGPMLVPFVIHTEKLWTPTPFIIITVVIFLCAVNSILLPETKDYKTLETVDEGIEFVQTRQIWRKKKSANKDESEPLEMKN